MKIAFTKAMGRFITIVSLILILISLLGTLALAFPEYFNFIKEMLGVDDDTIKNFALSAGGLGTMGAVGKTLKNSFNTQNALLVATQNAERELWRKEKEQLQINQNEFMEAFAIMQFKEVELLNESVKKQGLIIDFQTAYAKERINMSDTLVSQDIKNEYKAFIDRVEESKVDIEEIDPVILTETIETFVEVPITNKEARQRNKTSQNANKGVGIR